MTNVSPFKRTTKQDHIDAATGRFAHVYDTKEGVFRLRYGTGEEAGTMYTGLKLDDAQELAAMWMAGAKEHEMHTAAYKAGARG